MSKIRKEIWRSLLTAIKGDGWNMFFDDIIDNPSFFEKEIKDSLRVNHVGMKVYTNIEKKLVVKRHGLFKVTMYFWKETPKDYNNYGGGFSTVIREITNNMYTFSKLQSFVLNFALRRKVKRLKKAHEESLERAILLKVTGFDEV